MTRALEWISLADAHEWLGKRNAVLTITGVAVEMLTKAIRHNVLVRGMSWGERLPGRIEGREFRDLDLRNILDNELYLKANHTRVADFSSVEIARHEFEEFVCIEWSAYFQEDPLPSVPLAKAPDATIRRVIDKVYDHVAAVGAKPPNIKELPDLVQVRLEGMAYTATAARIMELGKSSANRRRPRGTTVASEQQQLARKVRRT